MSRRLIVTLLILVLFVSARIAHTRPAPPPQSPGQPSAGSASAARPSQEEGHPGQERTEPAGVFADGGILIVKTPDDRFKWWLDGRVMWDSAFYVGSRNQLASGGELRRGRLGFRMVFWKDWAAKFEVDFADNEAVVKDMWLAYIGFPNSMIKVGQYTEPFGFETLLSSRYSSFSERAVVHEVSPDRHLGLSYSRWGKRWQATGGLFGQAIGETDVTGESQGLDLTGRVTAIPIKTTAGLIHIGIAASYRTPQAAVDRLLADHDTFRLRARPETHVNRGYFVDTGRIGLVDHVAQRSFEAAGVFGPFSFQSEQVMTAVARQNGLATPHFSGWYVSGSWFLTGDQKPYDATSGLFSRVMPKRRRGAVELAARRSVMDLNDAKTGITGGREAITTVALNWYANPNVRVMFDWLRVTTDAFAVGDRHYLPNDTFGVIQARLQLHF